MAYGSMVHALEEIHRLLKPNGFLIDIHPVAEPLPVELHQNGKIQRIGDLEVPQWYVDFEQADEALVTIVRRGLFTVERESMFTALTYYDSVTELGAAFKESILKYARDARSADEALPAAATLAARAGELMKDANAGAQLVLRERDHISRLKPN